MPCISAHPFLASGMKSANRRDSVGTGATAAADPPLRDDLVGAGEQVDGLDHDQAAAPAFYRLASRMA